MTDEELFEKAIAIVSDEERVRFVEEAFGGRREECDRFLKLIAAHEEPDELLDDEHALGETQSCSNTVSDLIGKQIGPYKLLQQIGQGGFGVVYLAEESKTINRRVALKVIKPGMGSKEVIARFEAERQALAMMEHDNIARVFGGGTTDEGLPYFVMELVKGVPITEYCAQKHLSPVERIELFISVCCGVQHAHQKGIIHRDLKPSNILVAEHDHHPVVKIIDFGVAKALNQRLTERTLFTQYGSVIGTIQYMSPEQARFNQLDVDTRSDVFSLGVVLYELLTGNTPISKDRIQSASFEELIRWVREEEPSKPSTKIGAPDVSADSSSGKPEDVEHERQRLSRLIRGDLDWIVMKTLEKDRDHRYDSASELADDLRRFLNQEPVLASPPSVSYKINKFVRRNAGAVVAAVVVASLLLILGATILSWQFDRIDRSRIIAEKRAAELEVEVSRRQHQQREAEKKLTNETIPEIKFCIESGDNLAALQLLKSAKKMFPTDDRLTQLMATVSSRWMIRTKPSDARLTLWKYDQPDASPIVTAVTPAALDLAHGYYRFRLELDGHETVEGVAGPEAVSLDRTLDVKGSIPEDMVRIPASLTAGINHDFLIDRFEVTNRQYKEYVDKGGYGDRYLWATIIGSKDAFSTTVSKFVDETGHPGPRFWRDGTFLPGTDDMPVVGICWAEAQAYAATNQKRLPSIHHWNHASGQAEASAIIPKSNLSSNGLRTVGQTGSVGPYGTVDMLGNAAEWCFNAFGTSSRTIGGNSFLGPAYNLRAETPLSQVRRESFIGFRCIKLLESPQENLYVGLTDDRGTPFDGRSPVDDLEFEILRRAYSYDKSLPFKETPIESLDNFQLGMAREIYQIDAAYGGTIPIYVYRPSTPISSNAQMLIYMPGAGGFSQRSIGGSDAAVVNAVVASGRMIAVPVIFGMYERAKENSGSRSSSAAIAKQIKDIRRCLDFLRASKQYGHARFAYIGSSYGARLGPIACALEPNFEAAIYLNGGVKTNAPTPESDTVHFAPRAQQPALMLNGIEDHVFPVESSQKPMYRLLGADDDQKKHLLLGVGHSLQMEELTAHVDQFLADQFEAIATGSDTWRELAERYRSQASLAASRNQYEVTSTLLRKNIELLKKNGTADDAGQMFESQFWLCDSLPNRAFEQKIQIARELLADAQAAFGNEHPNTQRSRTLLSYNLLCHSLQRILELDDVSSAQFLKAKNDLLEVLEKIPSFSWPHLGLAATSIREGKVALAKEHLAKCESLPFTWDLEFFLRSHLANRDGNSQESEDWVHLLEVETTRHFQEGLLPRSTDRIMQMTTATVSDQPAVSGSVDDAITRLLVSYPNHYYLHWAKGLRSIRRQEISAAHSDFQKAYQLCPGNRSTDWFAITSQWLGDDEALSSCRKRLIELAQMKSGCYIWDGIHLARAYLRTNTEAGYGPEDLRVFEASVDHLLFYYSQKAVRNTERWLKYRQGNEVRASSFTHSGNPEEQAEAMIFDSITEYKFGDQRVAFDKLDAARKFVRTRIPSPDGSPFKYIGSEHAWCVSQLLLREATAMIELDSDVFDTRVLASIGRLRSELESEYGESNAKQMLLQVGQSLVQKYSESDLPSGPSGDKDD